MTVRWNVMALAAATALALGGCAVQQQRPGQLSVGLDMPELLGERLATFRLADGSEGHLRVMARQHSIKLQRYLKVVEIKPAQAVKLLRTEHFGDRTVLVVEKSNGNCLHQLELLLIRGADVATWTFGDCREPLQIERDGDALYFDRVTNNRLERIVYQDERMVRLRPVALNPTPTAAATAAQPPTGTRPTVRPRPGDAPPIVAAGTPRHVPGLPVPAEAFKAAVRDEPARPETRVAQAPAPAPTPASAQTQAAPASPPPASRPAAPAPAARARSDGGNAPPARPRSLPGEVAEDMQPIRLKLD